MTKQNPDRTSTSRAWASNFGAQIVAALILGLLLGLIATAMGKTTNGDANWLSSSLKTIGSTYVTLLTLCVAPLIFATIVTSISNLRNVTNAARLAAKTIVWFAITAAAAVIIGIVIGTIYTNLVPIDNTLKAADVSLRSAGTWWGFFQSLVPNNFIGLDGRTTITANSIITSLSFKPLHVLVISLFIGLAALKSGEAARPFQNVVASFLAVIQKVLWWIIRIAPLGTLGLIGNAVVQYGWAKMGGLAWFVVAIYIALAIVFFVLYPAFVALHGLSVKQFFSGIWPAVQLGFVSRSSIGTMPLTERIAERNLGVPSRYASFAVPLGATTKMDGCASVYPAIAALFIAEWYGIHLNFGQYLLIAAVSILGSAATAGTTGAFVMLTLTLSTVGLPLEGAGLLLAIDPIIDMGRTALNVAGQGLVPLIVAKRENILDLDLYNAPRKGNPFADESLSRSAEETAGAGAAASSEKPKTTECVTNSSS